MKTLNLIVFASATLLASTALPAMALDLSVGGTTVSAGSTGDGGTSVSASTGDTTASVSLGGGSNIASADATADDTGGSLSIANTSGDLVSVDGTDGSVNLGDLGLGDDVNDTLNSVTGLLGTTLDGTDLDGSAGGGGATGVQLAAAFGSLSAADQQQIRLRCRVVLGNPSGYSAETVALCRLLASR
jgi:hypothetical protein